MTNKLAKRAVNEVTSLSHAEFNSASRCLKAERFQIKFGMTLCNNNGFTRPSSLCSVSMRNIGAALYPDSARPARTGMTNAASGFTLIELLVVVLIIGILASVALPQYNKAVTKARVAEYEINLKTIGEAAYACMLQKNSVCSMDELDIDIPEAKPMLGIDKDTTACEYEIQNDESVVINVKCYTRQSARFTLLKYYMLPGSLKVPVWNASHTQLSYDTVPLQGLFCAVGEASCKKMGFQTSVASGLYSR